MRSTSRKIQIVLSCCLSLSFASVCYATNYYVETSGSYLSNGLSPVGAWSSISHAILNTANGDTIIIGTGNFTSELFSVTKELTIRGSDTYTALNPPLSRHTSQTFVSGPTTNMGQQIAKIETNNVTIRSMTFDGNFNTDFAAGIESRYGDLTVEYCSFRRLHSSTGGSYGILCYGTNAVATPDSLMNHINYNLFEDIIETNAAGILLDNAPAICTHNEFSTITSAIPQAGIAVISCNLTNNSPLRVSIDSNYLSNCTQAIWANNFGSQNQKINIRANIITNCLVGIRVTSANGQAIITSNTIYVGGAAPTAKATPARGIWVHADTDPWGAGVTDHQITQNSITDISANTGTVAILLEYDTQVGGGDNNGVRATVLDNSMTSFDIGLYVQSGTNDVSISNSPLVTVTAQNNEITDSGTWAIQADGMTNAVNASSNWFGIYTDPASVIDGNVDYTNWTTGSKYTDFDGDGTNDFLDADDDNDNLLDTNEIAIGTSPIAVDTDYDGQDDWDEYKITGTDPTDRKSVFKMVSVSNNTALGTYTLIWPSASNRMYALHRTTNITAGFIGAPMTNIADTAPTNTYTDTTATNGTYYYYQLVVTNTVP